MKFGQFEPIKNVIFYLFQGYKTSWKSTNNHFQRYSDVKPREERRSTVVDLANQAQVLQKVNGWKIYHLTSQMEDLVSVGIETGLNFYIL